MVSVGDTMKGPYMVYECKQNWCLPLIQYIVKSTSLGELFQSIENVKAAKALNQSGFWYYRSQDKWAEYVLPSKDGILQCSRQDNLLVSKYHFPLWQSGISLFLYCEWTMQVKSCFVKT